MNIFLGIQSNIFKMISIYIFVYNNKRDNDGNSGAIAQIDVWELSVEDIYHPYLFRLSTLFVWLNMILW